MNNALWNPWNWFHNEQSRSSTPRSGREVQASASMSPFGSLSQFYQEMDRMFDQTFRNFGNLSPGSLLNNMQAVAGMMPGMMFTPNVDITATDEEYTITVEVPGIDERDMRVELMENTLAISGEKRQENRSENAGFQRAERMYGSFQRMLNLPQDADQEEIEAEFRNGLLTIYVPRHASRRNQARRIEIRGQQEGARHSQEPRERPEREMSRNDNREPDKAPPPKKVA